MSIKYTYLYEIMSTLDFSDKATRTGTTKFQNFATDSHPVQHQTLDAPSFLSNKRRKT